MQTNGLKPNLLLSHQSWVLKPVYQNEFVIDQNFCSGSQNKERRFSFLLSYTEKQKEKRDFLCKLNTSYRDRNKVPVQLFWLKGSREKETQF